MPGRQIKKTTARSYVFYGRSSTGKTTIAGTFPAPILYLDIRDRGVDSIEDVIHKGGSMGRELETFEEVTDMYWWIKKHPNEYETVVLDTVTQMQQLRLLEIAQEKGKDAANIGDWGTLSRRDWGTVSGSMKEWLINYRDLVDLGMNVVFLAQERVFGNEDDENSPSQGMIVPEVGPAVVKSIAQTLNASVHVIGNTFIRERDETKEVRGKKKTTTKLEYCLRIGPNPYYLTKLRKPKGNEPPAMIVDPCYADIIEVLKGE